MKLTVRKKLMGGFLIVCILLSVVSIISISYMKQINDSYSDIIDRKIVIQNLIKDVTIETQNQALAMRGILLMNDQQSKDDLLASHEKITALLKQAKELIIVPEYAEKVSEMEKTNQLFEKRYEEFLQYAETHNSKDQIAYWKTNVSPAGIKIIAQAKEFITAVTKLVHDGSSENAKKVSFIIQTVITISIVSVILAFSIGFVISNMISKPLVRITQATEQIALGDFTLEEVQVKNKDELGVLADSFNQMVKNTRNLIQKVNISTEQVAASSEELMASSEQTTQATNHISTAIQEVAAGAETQNNSIKESARAIQEMAVGVQRVAEATSTVAEESKETTKEANDGNEAIQKVIQQMDKIHEAVLNTSTVIRQLEERSNEIGKITEVITSISDQTNLLSLNAAIEAARAGEHGKGFAVVADEVKKLAEQSKASADQIATLIQEIQKDTTRAVNVMKKGTNEVTVGISVVQETGEGFTRIQKSIDQVASQIQEISAVSEEMSASVQQVHASMDQVAQIVKHSSTNTQNVAAASEEQLASMDEITSATSSLTKMSEDLLTQIRHFKV